jgi:hypothetical protein
MSSGLVSKPPGAVSVDRLIRYAVPSGEMATHGSEVSRGPRQDLTQVGLQPWRVQTFKFSTDPQVAIRRGSYPSVSDLIAAIRRFIDSGTTATHPSYGPRPPNNTPTPHRRSTNIIYRALDSETNHL